MRGELIERMARDRINAGSLARLAGINASIEAIQPAADISAEKIEGGRAILADDGAAITLTVYALAEELIAAALLKLRTP